MDRTDRYRRLSPEPAWREGHGEESGGVRRRRGAGVKAVMAETQASRGIQRELCPCGCGGREGFLEEAVCVGGAVKSLALK